LGKKVKFGVLVGGALATWLNYKYRRQWLARLFKLTPVRNQVLINHSIKLTMPDGVKLATSHYAPKAEGKFPTILVRTPYGRRSWFNNYLALYFAERGYNLVQQDTRGRYDSEGVFEPFTNEDSDGQATATWISQQGWFDGNLAMWGPSYVGYVQWAVAVANPPYLKALMPCLTSSQFYTVFRQVFGLEGTLRWLTVLKTNSTGGFWKDLSAQNTAKHGREIKKANQHLPLGEADRMVVGQSVPFYQRWLEHTASDDPFWKQGDFSAQVGEVRAATHFVSGWYDFMLRELLADYNRLKMMGRSPYLTIGPWGHLSPGGLIEHVRQGLSWFDAQLKNDYSHLRQYPIRYFVTGAKEWREAASWPPPAHTNAFFLHERSRLSAVAPASSSAPDRYRYDPANPTPSVGGAIFSMKAGPKDNRIIEARPDVVCFTTPVLTGALEVIGPVKLQLYVNTTVETTDFFGRLCDVWPDGRSYNVCDGLVRLEPGQMERQADGSFCACIDLAATAHRFLVGHRLRLQVSSAAFPHWSRNLGTGEALATATRMLVAEQTIYHDQAHPSALLLPVAALEYK
jgi:putative CocE/NonD family hydrolase